MYTTIIHPLRKALNLSMHEYAVLDSIMKLSNNTEFSGWCVISREKLSRSLDLSKPTIIKIYNTLDQKGLIKTNSLGHARPVQSFIELFNPTNDVNIAVASESEILASVKKLTGGKETLQNGKETLPKSGKETLPYNNTVYNNINKDLLWKDDFEVYKDQLKVALKELLKDNDWILEQEKFNPNVDIQLTLEKATKNYWLTEEAWKKKKKASIKKINWKSTFANAISQKMNRVYKNTLFPNNETKGKKIEYLD